MTAATGWLAVAIGLAVVVASCGTGSAGTAAPVAQAGSASASASAQASSATSASASGTTEAAPVQPPSLPPIDREIIDAAMATAGDPSANVVPPRGAAAIDQEAAGTIVAHATASTVNARSRPSERSRVVESFLNPTDRGGPLVFQATGRSDDGWLEVLLPIRPNGTTGWIPVEAVELTINPYRIEVDASAHELTVYRYGTEEMSTTVSIGTGATPTPIGDFYLIELLRPSNPDGIYGPYAYGLSGYSDTLDSFGGGNGVIGIHGTNQPELLGQDVSHGCIRVANQTIAEMTRFLPLGTPVSIFRSDTSLLDVGERLEWP
ncbi:MAG: L,D-transpeptidase family protein [Acidimicrobiales bacterium]